MMNLCCVVVIRSGEQACTAYVMFKGFLFSRNCSFTHYIGPCTTRGKVRAACLCCFVFV